MILVLDRVMGFITEGVNILFKSTNGRFHVEFTLPLLCFLNLPQGVWNLNDGVAQCKKHDTSLHLYLAIV